ncbi:MAG TPA: hypothetical protein VH853_11840 [Polyangia bacterium]|jgi:hypothetical protein|nr:hypothetical protein [Polyangia bacterium]
MDAVSRSRFQTTFDNQTIDAQVDFDDPTLSGDAATARVYDAVDALDRRTTDLAPHAEVAVHGALERAAIAPAPISAAEGRQLAASARQMLAEEPPATAGESPWSLTGTATCLNSAIASPRYAGDGVWKCNVFVGEAFNRAGLSFPLSSVDHYASANSLATRSTSFQSVASLSDVRPGDLVSINRRGESGHVEIVTDVARDADGQVQTITTLGAHQQGLAEGTATAAPLVQGASRAAGQIGSSGVTIDGETFHLLRPMAPAPEARDLIRTGGPIKG